jgi:guanosine-3',5'-bis(diphosphate) 3'-pyrophosphohydrolase
LHLITPFFTHITAIEVGVIFAALAFLRALLIELALLAAAHMAFAVLAGYGFDTHIAVLAGFGAFIPFFLVHKNPFREPGQNCCRKWRAICPAFLMDPVLEQVRDFADNAHGGQLRKYSPDRYIVHPVRVMERCAEFGASRAQLAAALMHDVLEDTNVTEEDMLRFLRSVMEEAEAIHTLELVIALTDVYTTSAYPQWKRRRRKEAEVERMRDILPEAQTIKYADIIDNTLDIVKNDPNFAPRFLKRSAASCWQQWMPEIRRCVRWQRQRSEKAMMRCTASEEHDL